MAFILFLLPLLLHLPTISLSLPPSSLSPSLHQTRFPPSLCPSVCQFRLCSFQVANSGANITFPLSNSTLLRSAETASFPYICRNDIPLGQILSTHQPLIRANDKLVPISTWRPAGLQTPFSPSVFNIAHIPRTLWSGVAREEVTKDQWDVLDGKCVVLPIGSYQRYNPRSRATKKVDVGKEEQKEACVAFRTVAPTIHVELLWESGDDYDVDVIEPDGTRLFYSNTRSEAGVWVGGLSSYCETDVRFGREDITYAPSNKIQRGTYRVEVRHWGSCRDEFAQWRLTVTVKGEVRLKLDGVSNFADSRQVIGTGSFDYI